jgi:flagellar biosynthesis protein FlhF
VNTSTNVSTNASKIVAPSSRQALRLIREKLGPDAIILSNRVTPAGVEIVAIAENAAAQVAAAAPMLAVSDDAPAGAIPQAVSQPPAVEKTGSVIGEIQSMRNMIEEQLAGLLWNEKQKRDPARAQLLRILLEAGFSAQLAKAMLDHMPVGQDLSSGMAWVKSELMRTLPVLQNEDALLDAGGVYALMGPTGVGKTTTTAKLAARCVTRFGADKLALLTTDSYRIGAYEQLRIYGQIMGVSVHAISDDVDLRLVLDDLRDKHMVLIDTIGMSQRDRNVSEQVAMLRGAGRPVKRLLVLNAASHGDTLNEVVHAYRHAGAEGGGLAGCIFTKLDESTHPGALIDTVIRHRLPVHYVSSGQKVPENLTLANPAQLVESVFRTNSRTSLFVPVMADLADRTPTAHGSQKAQPDAAVERLRAQSRRLMQAMGHDSQQLQAVAAMLSKAGIGFDEMHALWRNLADETPGLEPLVQAVLTHARAEVGVSCRDYVLALQSKTDFGEENSGGSTALFSSLLLSDCGGIPLAAPNHMLTAALDSVNEGLQQVDWLQQQDFGKPVVHVLESIPAPALMRQWQASGVQWMVRTRADTAVAANGEVASTLAKLAGKLTFNAPERVVFKGKPALQSVAEMQVSLRIGARKETGMTNEPVPVLRCVVMRIADSRKGKPLAQWYLVTNASNRVTAQQIAQWHHWKLVAETYTKVLKHGCHHLGGHGQADNIDMRKRLLVAGQGSVLVWRLQNTSQDWAGLARNMLARLSGLQARPDQPVAGVTLLEGLNKLYALLDILDDQEALPPQTARMVAA